MTYKEAIEYIDRAYRLGVKPGLSRASYLLHALGNPQDKLKFVHVSGTNGKGSICSMLASVLRAAGYRTGLFTTPAIQRLNDRMQLDGVPISDDALSELMERIAPIADGMSDPCTGFELVTAAAILWFAEDGADIVVLEAGVGGRLDATNVIDTSICDIITSLSIDHTALLGDTMEQITFEKTGIFKGAPVVCYEQTAEVAEIITAAAAKRGAPVTWASFTDITCVDNSIDGQKFHYGIGPEYILPTLGDYQRKNAAVVLEAVNILRENGFKLSDEAVTYGLRTVKCPARFEVVCRRPIVVLDGAHNPHGTLTVAENLDTYFPGVWRVMLLGVQSDKEWQSMIEILSPLADAFVAVPPNAPSPLAPRALCDALEKFGRHAIARKSVEEGISTAINLCGKDGIVCCVGSLSMAGPIRDYFGLD